METDSNPGDDPNPGEGSHKRRRVEDEEKAIAVKRHDTLWFEDGNVVLVAGGTSFRVHTSILSLRSPVFKNMFAQDQPAAERREQDCPLVHVADRPQELGDFLDYIYNGAK